MNYDLLQLTLSDKVLLKFLQELQVQKVIWGQGLLSHHGLHGLNVFTDGIAGILQRKRKGERERSEKRGRERERERPREERKREEREEREG